MADRNTPLETLRDAREERVKGLSAAKRELLIAQAQRLAHVYPALVRRRRHTV
ncbi:MAG TPA: hypothetical protein VF913_12230 [Xanthobacteraceae bacterium]